MCLARVGNRTLKKVLRNRWTQLTKALVHFSGITELNNLSEL